MNILSFSAYSFDSLPILKPALITIFVILGVLLLSSIVITILNIKKIRRSTSGKIILAMLYIATLIVLLCAVICYNRYRDLVEDATMQTMAPTTLATTTPPSSSEETIETTIEETTVPTTVPEPTYEPNYTDTSNPENWKINWQVYQGNSLVENFSRPEPITFGIAKDYTQLEGIVTFRGNNYRTGATYGTANVTNNTLSKKWGRDISSFNKWSGCGWTGQPLIVRWDEETKAIMNLYAEKKAKTDLVEVIYATLDGNIYFYDLEDGSYTRDPIWVGMNFKGAGSLDPRGYPLMYVGAGDNANGKAPRMFIVSLVEGKILHEENGSDSIAHRRWFAFDSAPLVDAETDTLIWPCESGVLYTIKLNTKYDKTAGTLSVAPETTAKARYTTNTGRKLGCESSTLIVGKYLYFADNGGMFFCVDLNTMQPVWAQDTHDDVNATPVFQWGEDGKGYIYTGTSMEYANGTCYINKLDAATGEIVWEKKYEKVSYNSAVSGGVLSSPILGEKGTDLEGLIIYSISRTPTPGGGTLVALSTETGEVVWEKVLSNYAWSSPATINTETGKTYLILFDSVGKATLMDGKSGETVATLSLGSNVEASPAVFEDTIVVGTRGQQVFALKVE